MEVAIVIGAIIQVVTLIVFFVLAANVSKIKKNLHGAGGMGERYFNMAQEELYVGNKDKAKDLLTRAKYRYAVKEEKYIVDGESMPRSIIIKKIDEQLAEL